MVTIDAPGAEIAETVTDLWVELAAGQREHGSHILAGTNRARIRERILRHAVNDTLLVAREDGVVGFVTVERERGTFAQDDTRGVVTNLYVCPEYRGEGVGSALLSAAEDRLRELGVDTVALEVMADNEAARRFYRRAGYEPHRVELEKPVESDTHSKGDE
ncbi:MAG: GNAT family N-acetyltransferase [Haloarculaceae archaeon]